MRPILKFSPLLIIYLLMILFFSVDKLDHDEWRYLLYAENLLNGFFTDADNPYLMNGPGYPSFLAIFVGLHLPPIIAKLANGVLVFFAVLFLYRTLRLYVPEKWAFFSAYFMGLYWPMFKWMAYRISDFFFLFLLCAFIYFTVQLLRSEKFNLKNAFLPVFLLGYMILTKLFFGIFVLAGLGLAVLYYLVYRDSKAVKLISVMSIAWLLSAAPYLGYTYSLTGKTFYWGTNGGEQMYWMSSHLQGEYGNWFPDWMVIEDKIPGMDPSHKAFFDSAGFTPSHGIYFDSVFAVPHVQRDEIFKRTGGERMKKDPFGFAYNIAANSLRLAFFYPYSYRSQSLSTYPRLFYGLLLVIPLILSLIPAWLNRKALPAEIIFIGAYIPVYWGLISLVTGMPRHFLPMVPLILIWVPFIYAHFVQISFRNTLAGDEGSLDHREPEKAEVSSSVPPAG